MATANATLRRGRAFTAETALAVRLRVAITPAYHRPTPDRMAIAVSARAANQATLPWPFGTMMKAAASGATAWPKLPPTWKTDCASPCRPPDAMRATREDSGWKTEEPSPTSPAASSSVA